jgi:hypothetical protein
MNNFSFGVFQVSIWNQEKIEGEGGLSGATVSPMSCLLAQRWWMPYRPFSTARACVGTQLLLWTRPQQEVDALKPPRHPYLVRTVITSPFSLSLAPLPSSNCVGKFIVFTPTSPNCSRNQHRNSFAHRLSHPVPSLLAGAAQSPSSSSWLLSTSLWSSPPWTAHPGEPRVMPSCTLAPP